jgi:ADP-dependent phosphofructokinase/glucokinase|tara:strand:+ start:163 stop:390 length:228 start_codon:yes stop_codon:yes gene_type:complete
MSSDYKKVEGHAHIVKDVERGTILNTNVDEITAARKRKASKIMNKVETSKIKNDIENLKEDMEDIKSLLKQILEK